LSTSFARAGCSPQNARAGKTSAITLAGVPHAYETLRTFVRFDPELANLEDLTGLTFTLMVHDVPPDRTSGLLSSLDRATALRNGQTITVSAAHSLIDSARPRLSGPVFLYFQGLIEQFHGQRPDIRIIFQHTQGDPCFIDLQAQVNNGAFAGTHAIFGLCPPPTPEISYQVVREALDPKIGKAVSVVGANDRIDIPAFGIAIQSIVEKMSADMRKRLTPVQLLREGYERGWQRLARSLDYADGKKREAAIEQEFGSILAPVILQLLAEIGAQQLEQVFRVQPRYFNGMTWRERRGPSAVILAAYALPRQRAASPA
jgi:hypothetical protein